MNDTLKDNKCGRSISDELKEFLMDATKAIAMSNI